MDMSPIRITGLPKWLTDGLPPRSVLERHVLDMCRHAREWPGFIEHEAQILHYIRQTRPVEGSIVELWRAYKVVTG